MLAGVVITQNEEKNIARCLSSLGFCDEIIVVDSGSTDQTLDIARRYTPKVFHRDWMGYTAQKNFAVSLASTPWVLSVDADEEITPSLREEILSTLSRGSEEVAFSIPRKTFHSGKWIRFGGWYPNRLIRLFKKEQGQWKGEHLHEYWAPTGPVKDLQNPLHHYSFESISDQVRRNNLYSTLGAEQLYRQGIRFGYGKLLIKPLHKFIETYFIKKGFMDGCPGFLISVSAAYSVFLKWAKLWELKNEKEGTQNEGRIHHSH